jgi:spore germination cell wall hydrolase CwlJ-like protein
LRKTQKFNAVALYGTAAVTFASMLTLMFFVKSTVVDDTKILEAATVNRVITKQVKEEPIEPMQLYRVDEVIEISKKDRNCILRNIFHEARGEPFEGKIAVAQVTFNRLSDGRWGKTLCSVVFARSQFSWTLDRVKRNAKPGGPAWQESKLALEQYLAGTRVVNLERSTHFHATWMERKPGWAHKKENLTTIGQHTFYASLR